VLHDWSADRQTLQKHAYCRIWKLKAGKIFANFVHLEYFDRLASSDFYSGTFVIYGRDKTTVIQAYT